MEQTMKQLKQLFPNLGLWHNGERFNVQVATSGIDPYPDPFSCLIKIMDKNNDTLYSFKTCGYCVGNFAPILIHFKEDNGQASFAGVKIKKGKLLPAKTKGGDKEETPDVIEPVLPGYRRITVEELLRYPYP